MTKTVDYKTHGTCSRMIHVEIEDGIVRDVKFTGGCNGNTQGVAKLAIGRKADEVHGRGGQVLSGGIFHVSCGIATISVAYLNLKRFLWNKI